MTRNDGSTEPVGSWVGYRKNCLRKQDLNQDLKSLGEDTWVLSWASLAEETETADAKTGRGDSLGRLGGGGGIHLLLGPWGLACLCLHQCINPVIRLSGHATLLRNKQVNLLRGAQEAAVDPARKWKSQDPHQGQSGSEAHTLPSTTRPGWDLCWNMEGILSQNGWDSLPG